MNLILRRWRRDSDGGHRDDDIAPERRPSRTKSRGVRRRSVVSSSHEGNLHKERNDRFRVFGIGRSVCADYTENLRRTAPAAPTRPVANRPRVPGSGTGLALGAFGEEGRTKLMVSRPAPRLPLTFTVARFVLSVVAACAASERPAPRVTPAALLSEIARVYPLHGTRGPTLRHTSATVNVSNRPGTFA